MSYLKLGGGVPGTGGMIPHNQVGLNKYHVRNGQDRTMGTPGAVKNFCFNNTGGATVFFPRRARGHGAQLSYQTNGGGPE